MIDRYLSEVEASLRAIRLLIAHETIAVERPEHVPLAYLIGSDTLPQGYAVAPSNSFPLDPRTSRGVPLTVVHGHVILVAER